MKSAVLFALFAGISQISVASNYPPDYGHQNVRVAHQGPALFAHVGSGMMSNEVIGYKNSGELARSNPDSIDAILSSGCRTQDGALVTINYTVKLGREWHGTGYLSGPLSYYDFMPTACRNAMNGWEVGVAFSDGHGGWDSRGGQNYPLSHRTVWNNPDVVELKTHEGGYQINEKAWNFIVDQMRR